MTDTVLQVLIKGVDQGASGILENVGTLLTSLANLAGGAGTSMAEMGTKVEAAAAKTTLLETKAAAAAMQSQNLGMRAEQAAVQAEMFAAKADLGGIGAEAFGVKSQLAANRAQDFGVRAFTAAGQAEYLGTKATAAAAEAEKLATASEGVGTKLSLIGPLGLAAGAGIAIVADGLLKSTEAAAQWQTQLSQMQANTTLTTSEIAAMGSAVIDMSTKSGASLTDLAGGYQHIANIMGDTSTALNVLNVAQESAISTGGNVRDYSQTLARVLHEFGISGNEAAASMDLLHTAAAGGDLTLEQFTANSGNALAMASNYKVPLDQVAASYIALTKHGFDAAEANTQIADQFLRLTTVTPKVADELKRVSDLTGVDLVGDFTSAGLAAKGLTGIYADLRDAEHKMSMTSEEAFAENMLLGDSLRGGRGLAVDAGNGYEDYTKQLAANDDKVASATKRQDDYNCALTTTSGQFNILKANAEAAAVSVGGPMNTAFGGLLGVVNQTIRMAEAWNGTLLAMGEAWVTDADLGKAFADQMDHIGSSMDATSASIKIDTADLYEWGQAASEAGAAASIAMQEAARAAAAHMNASNYGPAAMDASNAGYDSRPDLGTDGGVAAVEAIAKEAGAAQVAADKEAKAQLKTNFDQALTDAKQHYADQKQTALDAATATKEIATTAAQDELDATKTGIEGEKKLYDDRKQADIKARQEQTTNALQELQKQETADNVFWAAVNAKANTDAAATNTRAVNAAAVTQKSEDTKLAAIQHTADESDTAWKNQVTALKDSATQGENALHTSNDAILKNAVDTAHDNYRDQVQAIDGIVKSREEGDAREIHSHELATASAIAGIESQKTAALHAIDEEVKAREEGDARDIHSHELASAANIRAIESEKKAALSAIDEETAAYAAQEAARVKLIDATLSASVRALNDQLADEKRANQERLEVNRMTKASGSVAGEELGAYFTATDAQIADTEAAIAAKAAGNQKLADADTVAAAKQAATTQAASDQLSAINQATADQMVAYKIQTDTTLTADNVAALTQQATAQKQALTNGLTAEKESQADKKQASTTFYDGQKTQETQALASYKWTMSQNLQAFKDAEAEKRRDTSAFYDGEKVQETKALADYKWTMAQSLQAFKDTEDQEKLTDKATLDQLLTSYATQQAAENARHANAIEKINAQAKADLAAIEALAQKRKDDYVIQMVERAAAFAKANMDRAAAYAEATTQRNADYTAATAARAADFKDAQQTINAKSAADIAAMQKALKEADTDFAARTKAADDHHKQEQADIAATYKADTDAINDAATKHNAALADRSKHMTDYTRDTDISWQTLITDAKNYAAAIGAAGTPGSFHAPGKGPQTFTASDFQGAGDAATSAYTGVYGDNAAAKWAADATANAAKGLGASGIEDLLSNGDILAKSALFLQGGAKFDYGSGANTFCERFVANMEGRSVMDTAAVAGGHRAAANQLHYDLYPPAGAEVYFGPNAGNEYMGHDGISLGNGMFRSVTNTGIRDASIGDWGAGVAPFLGWVPAHTPMYQEGGIVPGAYGQPSLAIVHGGEEYLGMQGQRGTLAGRSSDPIDYRQLAEAIVDALDRRPTTIHVDGQALGNITRTDGRRFNATSLPNGVGGL